MDFVDGNTSDPGTEPARGSDIPEDREDNSELMQAGILGANDKSEEAVLTDDQTQSPPSAKQPSAANTPWLESTATISTLDEEMLPVRPLGATAAAETSALVHRVPENCAHLEQDLQRREELERVQSQQQQLVALACSQQHLKFRKEVS